jgi:tetratricopeptide (TPR) repeat protein
VNYEFDFNKNWEWYELYSCDAAVSNQLIKNIQELSKDWSIDEGRYLFRCLIKLDSLNEILNLPQVIDTDSNTGKKTWKIAAAKELKYFNEAGTFRGLITAAITITKIKKYFSPDRKLFDNRKFYIKITEKIDTASHITINTKAASQILDLCSKNSPDENDFKIVNESDEINELFKNQNFGLSKELFLNFLNLSRNRKPIFEIYKLFNPYSYGGLGFVSTHLNEFKNVVQSLDANQGKLKFYVISLLSQFFPKGAWLEANVLFLFGNFEKTHKYYLGMNEEYQEKLKVNLNILGDDYEYLARYLTRRLFIYEKYNTQLDIFPYYFKNEDTLILQLLTEVYDGGISNYMAPILESNRPLSLLEIDFLHFKTTTNAILFKKKKTVIDSLLKAGLGGRFLFYTMGAQMAYTIDRTLGRTALNDALLYGPIEFFKIYIDAYEADKKQITEKFRFNDAFEEKIFQMRKMIPKEIYKDMYDINVRYIDPAPIPGVVEKLKKKYIDSKEDAANFYLIGGQLLFDNMFYDKSLVYFNKCINELPDKLSVSRRIGLLYYYKGAFREAIEMLSNYIKLSPVSADAYVYRGMAYYMDKQYEKAKTDFEKVLQIDSSNEEAKNYLDSIKENGF